MINYKYTPPLQVRYEPVTRKEIADEISELREWKRGSEPRLQAWVDKRIAELQARLETLK